MGTSKGYAFTACNIPDYSFRILCLNKGKSDRFHCLYIKYVCVHYTNVCVQYNRPILLNHNLEISESSDWDWAWRWAKFVNYFASYKMIFFLNLTTISMVVIWPTWWGRSWQIDDDIDLADFLWNLIAFPSHGNFIFPMTKRYSQMSPG